MDRQLHSGLLYGFTYFYYYIPFWINFLILRQTQDMPNDNLSLITLMLSLKILTEKVHQRSVYPYLTTSPTNHPPTAHSSVCSVVIGRISSRTTTRTHTQHPLVYFHCCFSHTYGRYLTPTHTHTNIVTRNEE